MQSRPEITQHIFYEDKNEARAQSLRWGVYANVMKPQSKKTFISRATNQLKKRREIKKGDRVAFIDGNIHAEGFNVRKTE